MEAVVSMVPPQSFIIADVGCDHAYVSIALRKRNMAKKVIAMDVRTGPLNIARKNIQEAGYTEDIDIRLGDGLEKLESGEADTIIIAGMGGLLMNGILERGKKCLLTETKKPVLILQPQSDIAEVRKFLYRQGYHIVCETMLEEDGKYYTVIKAEPDCDCESKENRYETVDELKVSLKEKPYSEEEWIYGRWNLIHQDSVLYDFLQKELQVRKQILAAVQNSINTSIQNGEKVSDSTRSRIGSVGNEIAVIEKALLYYTKE